MDIEKELETISKKYSVTQDFVADNIRDTINKMKKVQPLAYSKILNLLINDLDGAAQEIDMQGQYDEANEIGAAAMAVRKLHRELKRTMTLSSMKIGQTVSVEADTFDDLQDELDKLERKGRQLGRKYDYDFEDLRDVFLEFAKDPDDHREVTNWLSDLETNIESDKEEGKDVKEIQEFYDELSELSDNISNGNFEDEEDEDAPNTATDDEGYTYTHPDVVRFVLDMQKEGFKVGHYKGRFYWEGPAVQTDRNNGPDLEEITRATRVKLQHDNMGLDLIVYPKTSDKGHKA